MNKLLAYGLWILLSLYSVSAIWCLDCEKISLKEECPKEQQVWCWAGLRESCFTQNLYIGANILFVRFGCIKGCKNVYTPASFLWHSVTCCNKNNCNERSPE